MALSTAPTAPFALIGPRTLVHRAFAANAPLALAGMLMLLGLVASLIGVLVDPTVITGAPAWLKPAKFYISLATYCFTLIWLLSFVTGRPRLVGLIAWITVVGFVIELAVISLQVARGVGSHFNTATLFDAAIYSLMGATITVVWMTSVLLAVLLLRQRMPDTTLAWGLRLGVLLAVVGIGIAFLMTSPRPEQLAAAQAGQGMPLAGAHSVGLKDGAAGLPILNWSTIGGDLRVPHFIGIHAMQVLPLVAFAVDRTRLRGGSRVSLVVIAGAAYGGLIALLTWQALRGQSIVRPDALTLGAAGALVGAAALAVAAVLLLARPVAQPDGGMVSK